MDILSNIDYELLKEQRAQLIDLIWEKPDSDLWGIVDLLDMMIDKYERG